ncbi:hypothetical protein, partial [Pseudomonas sp. URMO17WK12:I1]|uniref:hypothetical protein n=1 Tax=Pseudomonas sp. URMO17WK12:I1 TaxID=1261625 RepID=UPI001C463190
STPCSARPDHLLSSGRRILQRYKPLSTPSFTAFDQPDQTINSATQTTLSMPAHSTRIRRPCNPYFHLTH